MNVELLGCFTTANAGEVISFQNFESGLLPSRILELFGVCHVEAKIPLRIVVRTPG